MFNQFTQNNLAASLTNILLQCRLYVVQCPGGSFLYKWVQGCASITGVRFSHPFKVCFSTSNYMKSHYFHSSHYLNMSTIYNIGIRQIFLESYFLETIFAIVNYTYKVCSYIKLYEKSMAFGLGLYMNRGGGLQEILTFFQP